MDAMTRAAGTKWAELVGRLVSTIVELAGARCGVDWTTTSGTTLPATPQAKPSLANT